MTTLTCAWCEKPINAKRSTKRFCDGSACRTAWMRNGRKPRPKTPLDEFDAWVEQLLEAAREAFSSQQPPRTPAHTVMTNAFSEALQVLGLSLDATLEQSRTRFHALAHELHPDKNPGIDPAAFYRVSEAWKVIKGHFAAETSVGE
jgi:hypothetical protein